MTATAFESAAPPHLDFVDGTTVRQILNISDEVLDQAMATAYQLYRAGRFHDAATVCKGLIACDHRYWWSYSLYASALRRLDRHAEALTFVERGLIYEPDQPKLVLMRAELKATLARVTARAIATNGQGGAP